MYIGSATYAQNYKPTDIIGVTGKIINTGNHTAVPYVHIININTKQATISDENGKFSISINRKDTLLFSAIGFEKSKLYIRDTLQTKNIYVYTIYLKTKIYNLQAVTIHPYPTYEEFKQAFINLKLPDDIKIELNLPQIAVNNNSIGNPGSILCSPVTYFYDKFSRKAKFKRFFDESIRKTEYREYITSKYNEDIVKKVTKLNDSEEIKSFMAFCDLTDEFIEKANDYEIIIAINECHEKYIKLK